MQFLEISTDERVELAPQGGIADQVHLFEKKTITAINASLASSRPLLVRGEPGIGKSQLARAAAKALGRIFLQEVVDSRTEAQDLLWHFDAIERLAEAQLAGALGEEGQSVRKRLAVNNFLRPGVLWWAYSWSGAAAQAEIVNVAPPPQPDGGKAENGAVVLIDEIDKAETDVPNGLLEALGNGQFTPFGHTEAVVSSDPAAFGGDNDQRRESFAGRLCSTLSGSASRLAQRKAAGGASDWARKGAFSRSVRRYPDHGCEAASRGPKGRCRGTVSAVAGASRVSRSFEGA